MKFKDISPEQILKRKIIFELLDRFRDKVRHTLKDKSKLYFRKAGGAYLDGKDVRAGLWLAVSFMHHPSTYLTRILRELRAGV
jgi:hypothetical protein